MVLNSDATAFDLFKMELGLLILPDIASTYPSALGWNKEEEGATLRDLERRFVVIPIIVLLAI